MKNRFITSPMVTGMASPSSEITDRLIAYHVARSEGGFALNMLEATSVEPAGYSYYCGTKLSEDSNIPGHRRLTEAVHNAGGKIGIQLQHGGYRSNIKNSDSLPARLVSFIPGITPYERSRVMNRQDMEAVIDAFAQAALRAKQAGYDLVEIHGGHGYLLSEFMSPYFNKRHDEYGGSLENRVRFPLEVVQAVRKTIGDFPLSIRISSEEFIPEGYHLEEACEMAKMFAEYVDLIDVSIAIPPSNYYSSACSHMQPGWNVFRADAIKKAVGNACAVAVVGRMGDYEVAEKAVSFGSADIVVIGRASVADPELPKKMQEKRFDDIIPCMCCNEGCHEHRDKFNDFTCAVNPKTGHENLYKVIPALKRKKIVVIGGGPAGLTAAATAAQRGHEVIVFEQKAICGGRAITASMPPFKTPYKKLAEYLERQALKAGVEIRYNQEANVNNICELQPDHVFVAIGGKPIIPAFCQGRAVLIAEEVLHGKETGDNVAIIGGGLVGTETAEFLLDQGKKVTLIEMRPEIAIDMEPRERKLLLKILKEKVAFLTGTKVLSTEDDGTIRVLNNRNREKLLTGFNSIVLALGYAANSELAWDIEERGISVTALGDCHKAGKMLDAIHGAYCSALEI